MQAKTPPFLAKDAVGSGTLRFWVNPCSRVRVRVRVGKHVRRVHYTPPQLGY